MKKILVTLPNLNYPGGVSAFWNALLPEFEQNRELKLIPFEIGGHGKNPLGPIKDQWNFFKAQNNSDLTVLNPSLGARSFFRDGLFAKQLVLRKKRFVVFFHGWDLDFEQKVSERYLSFFKKTFAKAQQIFVLSKDFGDKLRSWGYKGKITVETTTIESNLVNGFSMESKIRELHQTKDLKLLFMSRLIKEKGVFETIDAFRKLKREFPHLELIIAGDGPDFKAVSEEIKDERGIRLLGYVSGNEKRKILEESHIYCLPSYTEGLPTSVLEAMFFGMPVVTTPVGGLKYFFIDGKMGFLSDLNQDNNLPLQLKRILDNKEGMVKMGRYNHDFALQNLIAPKVAQRLGSHFDNCIMNVLEQ